MSDLIAAAANTGNHAPAPATTPQITIGEFSEEAVERAIRLTDPAQPATVDFSGYNFGGRVIAPEESAFFANLGAHMKEQGVGAVAVAEGVKWLDSIVDGPPAAQARQHPYDFRGSGFDSEADQPYLNAFGNAMAKIGASEADVFAMLRWYSDLSKLNEPGRTHSDGGGQDVAQADQQHRSEAIAAMRREWGEGYRSNLKVLNTWLDKLPPAERAAIEQEQDSRGVLALNNPTRLRELLRQALAAAPAGAPADEIARIEGWMRAHPDSPDGRRYWRDEKAQARLRELYAQRG